MKFNQFLTLSNFEKAALVKLDLQGELTQLTDAQWQIFEQTFVQCVALTSLAFHACSLSLLTSDQWKILGKIFAQCQSLTTLNVGHSNPSAGARLQPHYKYISNQWNSLCQALSQCQSLTSLSLENNALPDLTLDQWETLKQVLVQNYGLTSLNLSWNQLSRLTTENWRILSKILFQCKNLTTLNLGYNDLGSLSTPWEIFCQTLVQCRALKSLDLSSNRLAELTFEKSQLLGQSLAQCTELIELNLRGNWLNKRTENFQWQIISQILIHCQGVTSLNLANNALNTLTEEIQWQALSRALVECRGLMSLNLGSNNLGLFTEKQWIFLGKILAQCPTLTVLNLEDNALGKFNSSQWQAFGQLLTQCPKLITLELRGNDFEKFSLQQSQMYIDILSQNNTLLYVNDYSGHCNRKMHAAFLAILERNRASVPPQKCGDISGLSIEPFNPKITSEFIEEQCNIILNELLRISGVTEKSKLTVLSLNENILLQLTEMQWTLFGRALAQCQKLTTLTLETNCLHKFTEAKWQALGQAFSQCTALTTLNFEPRNGINSLTKMELFLFGQVLAQCSALTVLNLKVPHLRDLGSDWQAFCQIFAQCHKLRILNLRSCNLNWLKLSEQWQTFGEILVQCQELTSLDLRDNHLDQLKESAWTSFCQMLAQCSKLTTINYENNDLTTEKIMEIQAILKKNQGTISTAVKISPRFKDSNKTYIKPELNPSSNVVINFLGRLAEMAYEDERTIEASILEKTGETITLLKADTTHESCRVFLAYSEKYNMKFIVIRGTVFQLPLAATAAVLMNTLLGAIVLKDSNDLDDIRVCMDIDYNEWSIVKHVEKFIIEATHEGLIASTDKVATVGHSLAAPVAVIMAARHGTQENQWKSFGFDSPFLGPKQIEILKREPHFNELNIVSYQFSYNLVNTCWPNIFGSVYRLIRSYEAKIEIINESALFIILPNGKDVYDFSGETLISIEDVDSRSSFLLVRMQHSIGKNIDTHANNKGYFTEERLVLATSNASSQLAYPFVFEISEYFQSLADVENKKLFTSKIVDEKLYTHDVLDIIYNAYRKTSNPVSSVIVNKQKSLLEIKQSIEKTKNDVVKYYEQELQHIYRKEWAIQLLSPSHFSEEMKQKIVWDEKCLQGAKERPSYFVPPSQIYSFEQPKMEPHWAEALEWWNGKELTLFNGENTDGTITLPSILALLNLAIDMIAYFKLSKKQREIDGICDKIKDHYTPAKTKKYYNDIDNNDCLDKPDDKNPMENKFMYSPPWEKQMFRNMAFKSIYTDYIRSVYLGKDSNDPYHRAIEQALNEKKSELETKRLYGNECAYAYNPAPGGYLSPEDSEKLQKIERALNEKNPKKMLSVIVELEGFRCRETKQMAESYGIERDNAIDEYFRLEDYAKISTNFYLLASERAKNGYNIQFKDSLKKVKKNILYLYIKDTKLTCTVKKPEFTVLLTEPQFCLIKERLIGYGDRAESIACLSTPEIILVMDEMCKRGYIQINQHLKDQISHTLETTYYKAFKDKHPEMKKKYLDYCIEQEPIKAIPMLIQCGVKDSLETAIRLLRQMGRSDEADVIMHQLSEKRAYFYVRGVARENATQKEKDKAFEEAAKLLIIIPYSSGIIIQCVRAFFYDEMIFCEKNGKYQEAIKLGNLFISTFKEGENEEIYYCKRWLMNVNFKIGNYDSATNILKDMLEGYADLSLFKNELDMIKKLAENPLARKESVDAIIQLSTDLHAKSAAGTSSENTHESPNFKVTNYRTASYNFSSFIKLSTAAAIRSIKESKHVKEIKETKSSGRMLHSLKNDIHTLFRQGYRFSTERPGDNKEKLNVCVESRPKSTDGHSELEMAQAKFVNIIFNQPACLSGVYNEEKRQFLVKGQLPFIDQMDKELKNITAEYEQETGIKGCTMS